MVEKSSKPRRAPPKPGSTRASGQSDADPAGNTQTARKPMVRRKRLSLQERIMEHLADIPALLAVSTLSEMLRETADRPTRLAILKARIDVLRARTIACRLGKPADSSVTLSALLDRNATVDVIPPETAAPIIEEEQTVQPPAPAPIAPPDMQENMRIELTEAHIHQGVQLPKGATLVVNAAIGASLIEMEVAKPVIEDAPDGEDIEPEEGKTPDPDDADAAAS